MKIIMVITGLSTGGAESMLLRLLTNIDREIFDIEVVSLSDKGGIADQIEGLGITVYALGMKPQRINLVKFFWLVKYLYITKPDIVHTWLYHSDLVAGLASKLAGVKHLLWSLRHSNLSRDHNKRTTLLIVRFCAILSYWLPQRIVSCSNKAKLVHVESGYVKEKIKVIHNGFDLEHFMPEYDCPLPNDLKSRMGTPSSLFLIGMVARFHPLKNHLGFLCAAEKIVNKIANVRFLLIGSGVDYDNPILVESIKEKGIEEHVCLLGKRNDVAQLMPAFDLLVSPSHGEGFPNVVGEAMACEVPCVVTDAGDSGFLVGKTGRVVPTGNMKALADEVVDLLMMNSEDRRLLGIQARERINKHFEIKTITRAYQELYQSEVAVCL